MQILFSLLLESNRNIFSLKTLWVLFVLVETYTFYFKYDVIKRFSKTDDTEKDDQV